MQNSALLKQAGFRKGKSCSDQIATLRIITEQSMEWQSNLYLNFINFEKGFDSVDREVIWKLLEYYGVPQIFTNLIQQLYDNGTCQVIHNGKLSEAFGVNTGVRQGCWVIITNDIPNCGGLDYASDSGKGEDRDILDRREELRRPGFRAWMIYV
uniref:Reverse transcriptase domain-containing protein n=1 Tax=Trichobilharzia regenti TaxID=157069 RepID=A0AA85JDF9_TRIRE|nr:unnamed protein product [Trichobilharzia regenti]